MDILHLHRYIRGHIMVVITDIMDGMILGIGITGDGGGRVGGLHGIGVLHGIGGDHLGLGDIAGHGVHLGDGVQHGDRRGA